MTRRKTMTSIDPSFGPIRDMQVRLDAIERQLPEASLKEGGGGGTSGGMRDDWKASVDQQLNRLHDDVRNLLYGLLALAVAGCGLYAMLNSQLNGIEVKQASIETKIEQIDARTADMAKKIDELVVAKPAKK